VRTRAPTLIGGRCADCGARAFRSRLYARAAMGENIVPEKLRVPHALCLQRRPYCAQKMEAADEDRLERLSHRFRALDAGTTGSRIPVGLFSKLGRYVVIPMILAAVLTGIFVPLTHRNTSTAHTKVLPHASAAAAMSVFDPALTAAWKEVMLVNGTGRATIDELEKNCPSCWSEGRNVESRIGQFR